MQMLRQKALFGGSSGVKGFGRRRVLMQRAEKYVKVLMVYIGLKRFWCCLV